ncbi:unnamed protein product [Adineta ricciae]|uniref:NAD(P)(+)--arginine ADP-ribosyltransferase n=1 Tax=Adineta ricciae TaxID=249248 RepID=A0A814S9K7_ADIRI|nr:unnamed protein product [Adineta ricciae]CAF1213010.1 unnamed protein product [Adineta ricciae]
MATHTLTQEKNNLESICLVWLDSSVNASNDNVNAQRLLRMIMIYLKVFDNVQDCEQYLQEASRDDRIFLVVSGQLGQVIVPKIHHIRQIAIIYVYCMNKKRNEEWTKMFPKIKGVFIKFEGLFQQIQLDRTKLRESGVDEPVALALSNLSGGTDRSTNTLNNDFLYSQLLVDCLIRMTPTSSDKNELIEVCNQIYADSPNELTLLKEFQETYSSNRAIWWYTRETFLYRLLNKALRTKNFHLLFLFRFFLRDVSQQLKANQCTTSIRVYRGQLLSQEELDQLTNSLGEYLSINSFFSTSLNRQKALRFLKDESSSDCVQKILFEIDADPNENHSKPFANIASLSSYSTEQEILFMLGSVFRVMNIKQDKNDYWIIQMVFSNDHNENLQRLYDHIKDEHTDINEETSLVTFGTLLHKMGEYDLAEGYFSRLIHELPNDKQILSKSYHALGVLALLKDDYEKSLNYHKKSLEILKFDDPCLATSYNCIGCIYQKQGDFRNALEFYTKAWDIWRKLLGEHYYQIADVLNNMGCIYENEKNYSKALEFHQKALAIRQKSLPKDHFDLAASYNNIGNIYLCLIEYDLALENYYLSLDIKIKCLPSHHLSLVSTLHNIGIVYEQKSLYQQALTYFEKAMRILRENQPSTNSYIIDLDQNIQRVSSLLNSELHVTYF